MVTSSLNAVEPTRHSLAGAPVLPSAEAHEPTTPADGRLREVFDQFVGETFYGQLLRSMRSTVGKPAYFHGGRAEEAFQSQLDQVLAQQMTTATQTPFSDALFQLFQLNRT